MNFSMEFYMYNTVHLFTSKPCCEHVDCTSCKGIHVDAYHLMLICAKM